jgi:hypothetical protein
MKWIKNRESFLNEAKIRDVLNKRQIIEVSSQWGERYLDYEEVDPTDQIKQGRWKLSIEDKMKVLGHFFSSRYDGSGIDMNVIFNTFKNLPDNFINILRDSINIDSFRSEADKKKYGVIFRNFDPKYPTIDQIACIYNSVFRKLSLETRETSFIKRDGNGRPIVNDDGDMIRIEKEAGFPIFERNLVNIKGFVESYNRCYDNRIDEDIFYSSEIGDLVSFAKENHNSEYKIDFEIFNKDIYLSINHKASDILNISISTFYSSCQHLYSGGHREHLLSNVFDPNSIPAFLIFDTPIFWDDEKISDFLPLSRMMVRSIESFDSDEKRIFFDRSYPDRMQNIFGEIIEKYSGNKQNFKSEEGSYIFAPDIDLSDNLDRPYMDRLSDVRVPFIGKNTKNLYLNRNHNWSKVRISPNANIKQLVIETENLPDKFKDLKLNLEWVKFKYMIINSFEPFKSIKTDSLSFDRCKFDAKILQDLELKKLQIISCDLKGDLDLSIFKNLEELHLIYTLDELEYLKNAIEGTNLKKLVVSGDLFTSKEGKDYLKSLKNEIKVELVGPLI